MLYSVARSHPGTFSNIGNDLGREKVIKNVLRYSTEGVNFAVLKLDLHLPIRWIVTNRVHYGGANRNHFHFKST